MCGLGRLYAKQNVIEALLEKDKIPESCAHIKSMKDIKDLNLTPNPAFKEDEGKSAPFICALIGLEMSGKFKFVALWTCGCVFSERALKELKTNVCTICQTPYTEEDIVILNGVEEDVDLMRTKMEARQARLKAAKKDKKKSKKEVTATVTSGTAEQEPSTSKQGESQEQPSTSSKIGPKLPIVANPISKQQNKRALISDKISTDPLFKKSKADYSIQEDKSKNSTEVYKSIFTTHEDEKQQKRAHWVTYNPFYN